LCREDEVRFEEYRLGLESYTPVIGEKALIGPGGIAEISAQAGDETHLFAFHVTTLGNILERKNRKRIHSKRIQRVRNENGRAACVYYDVPVGVFLGDHPEDVREYLLRRSLAHRLAVQVVRFEENLLVRPPVHIDLAGGNERNTLQFPDEIGSPALILVVVKIKIAEIREATTVTVDRVERLRIG